VTWFAGHIKWWLAVLVSLLIVTWIGGNEITEIVSRNPPSDS